MIISLKNRHYALWNKKLNNTIRYSPTILKLIFNKNSNELDFKATGLFNTSVYSIEELESMVKELKKVNKELIDNEK